MSNKEELIEQYQKNNVKIETFAETLIDEFKTKGFLDADQSKWLIEYLLIERGD